MRERRRVGNVEGRRKDQRGTYHRQGKGEPEDDIKSSSVKEEKIEVKQGEKEEKDEMKEEIESARKMRRAAERRRIREVRESYWDQEEDSHIRTTEIDSEEELKRFERRGSGEERRVSQEMIAVV